MTKDGRVSRKFNLQRQVEQDLVSRLQFSQHVTPGPKSLPGNSKFFCQDITHTMLLIFYLLTQITGLCFGSQENMISIFRVRNGKIFLSSDVSTFPRVFCNAGHKQKLQE